MIFMNYIKHDNDHEDKQHFRISPRDLAVFLAAIIIVSSILGLLVSYLDAFLFFIFKR